jgi:glycerophosphodiester phosphodiesterase
MGLDPSKHQQRSSFYYGLRDKLTTLADAFRRVPESCGFNIEMKYPSAQEVREEALVVADRNTYVDSVLDCVFSNAGERGVLFSSFDPDVCMLLQRKQGTYPVLFLTEAGTSFDADPRRNSLREAIRFARSVGLFGIVSNSGPLLEAPVLMDAVRGAGLVLATYGKRNNDIECVKLQQDHGVAAIIVDHVAHISRGLRAK